ncbi:MAG TPA: N-acetylneuraminate synthase family protein, partial [Bacteroidia bacterium]|nr:N-acetylneuraminate synthase family protein [Bacteroidia bacterium]
MNKEIRIRDKVIGNGNPPFVIAEMACAHDGIFEKALKLVDAAVDADADAVQLQFFIPDETVTPNHPVYDVVKKIAFDAESWRKIFKHARGKNIAVFVCAYDVPSVNLAIECRADAIKLNSADLSNPDVLSAVAASGIPFTLGTGASTLDEIANGIAFASSHGARNIILMHGVQNFPTKIEDLNISRVELLKEVFDMPVGYHDHVDGEDPFGKIVDLIAIGLGACVIEKHITCDRSEKGIDYQAALEPAEFKQFVAQVRKAFVAYGSKKLRPFTESDIRYRKFQKKSVVAARAIKAGE